MLSKYQSDFSTIYIYIPEIICTISGDISIRLMFKFLYDAYIVYCKYTCVRVRVPRFPVFFG